MPSVHRRSRSPFYHASFCGPDGRWLLRSTKQTDKTKAFAVALQWDRAAKLAKRGELVEAQAREVVGDIMKLADIGETLRAISIEEHFREWLDTKKARSQVEASCGTMRSAVPHSRPPRRVPSPVTRDWGGA